MVDGQPETGGEVQRGGRVVIKRHALLTRITHWMWAVCLFFLLLSGLQIFNAHPRLYIGQESGFSYDNAVFGIGAFRMDDGRIVGMTDAFGRRIDTTGVLGVSGDSAQPDLQAFPRWLTIPSYRDLGTGRVVHFFFGWLFVITLAVWMVSGLVNGHIRRDLIPGPRSWRDLPADIMEHMRFRFRHRRRYSALQKISYGGVLFILFPLIILTGLAMSPNMNAAWPWLIDVFGGRQTARTLHFGVMVLLVAFFFVHIMMVLLAGPVNRMRAMITGRYRIDDEEERP